VRSRGPGAAAWVLLALAALVPTPAVAGHVPPRPGCFYDGHSAYICTPCPPHQEMVYARCVDLPVAPPPECRVLVRYDPRNPASVRIEEPAAHCDRAGIELAIAQILAKLLGAP
jgi:hypothetical protein